MMPMMLAQEASIIDIIGVPFLLPKPSGAVLVFEAVLAGAPHRACVQNGACEDETSLRGARRMRAQGVQGQGCPQHESTQPGPLTLLPHKTRVRHKNRHRSKQSAKRV